MRPAGSDVCRYKTDNSPTMRRHATSLRSAGSEVVEWGGTWDEDGGGGARVCMRWDGWGGVQGGRSESEWVGIGRNRGFSDTKRLYRD